VIETKTAELRNWRKHIYKLDGTYVLWGNVYSDNSLRFPDGHWIHTSAVKFIENGIAFTKTGSQYTLIGEQIVPDIDCRNIE